MRQRHLIGLVFVVASSAAAYGSVRAQVAAFLMAFGVLVAERRDRS